jgi:acetyl-CoA C-acetyltransferase
MRSVVVVAAARTPITRARKGALASTDAFALARSIVTSVLVRSGVPTADVDDIVLAESLQGGGVIARHTAVALGMLGVPGLAVNRHCAGGLAAVQTAVANVLAGAADVVVAGGIESLSTMPQVSRRNADGELSAWMSPSHPATADAPSHDMTITVGENTARELGLTRRDVDEWAAYSHGRAIAAIDGGYFADEIAPVLTDEGVKVVDDEQPRRGVTADNLAVLAPLRPELPDATVTAGNAAGLNDAAAAVVVTTADYAAAHGLHPLARVRGWANAALDPARTGLTPTVAAPRALERANLTLGDIDLWEINEAFCSVPVAFSRTLGVDPHTMNPVGSGCSLGHPIAATGTRMVVSMVNALARTGGTLGLVGMCAGGGMGSALVIERM